MNLLQLPTSSTTGKASVVAIARQLARLVGAGWQCPQDSLNAADVLAFGAGFDDARDELLTLLAQAFSTTTTLLLAELESTYGVPVDTSLTIEERQDRLTAVLRASISGSPTSIDGALESLVGIPVTVVECTSPGPGSASDRYRFVVLVPTNFVTQPNLQRVRDILDRMKPAHTAYTVAGYFPFYCDGVNNSFCDYTALGV